MPWKRGRDPYRIWIAEIMLQQTQVTTVIPYYLRFTERFPNLRALAAARLDAVLRQWSGLGYYARARNLHKAARLIVMEHGGHFPRSFEAIHALPGIGRSTAGAIAAQAYGERLPILDGNVKRVLARLHAIDAPLDDHATEQRLWQLAQALTPRARVADYTQAIMDLGALVCRRAKPGCERCPAAAHCAARRLGLTELIPRPRARRALPVRRTRMLLLRDQTQRVLLVRRPPSGVWGGLWSLPQFDGEDPRRYCRHAFGLEVDTGEAWPVVRHSFTHFHLDITPVPARLVGMRAVAMENADAVWYNARSAASRAVATPIKKLLRQLGRSDTR